MIWREIGKEVDINDSTRDILVTLGLDWQVEKRRLDFDASPYCDMIVPDKCATAKVTLSSVDYLGTVGRDYHIISNRDQCEFIKAVCRQTEGAKVVSAGEIDCGKKVFWVIELAGLDEVVPGDRIQKYLVILNSHDGKGSFKAFLTNKRLWCSNMFVSAFRGSDGVAIRHTLSAEERMLEAESLITKTTFMQEQLMTTFRDLTQKVFDIDTVDGFLLCVFNPSNPEGKAWKDKKAVIQHSIQEERDGSILTAWQLFNGITRYCTHSTKRTGIKLFTSIVNGVDAKICAKALELLVVL